MIMEDSGDREDLADAAPADMDPAEVRAVLEASAGALADRWARAWGEDSTETHRHRRDRDGADAVLSRFPGSF